MSACLLLSIFLIFLSPSLHTNMMKEFKRGVRVGVCVCVCVCLLISLTLNPKENKKSYCNLDTIKYVYTRQDWDTLPKSWTPLWRPEWTSTHKGTLSTGCPWWLGCGWTSTELIRVFSPWKPILYEVGLR
jgi:hypothetical protein